MAVVKAVTVVVEVGGVGGDIGGNGSGGGGWRWRWKRR